MLHARWAMLGVVGLVVPDLAGGPLYLLPDLASLPLLTFTIQAVVALGALEIYRGARRLEACPVPFHLSSDRSSMAPTLALLRATEHLSYCSIKPPAPALLLNRARTGRIYVFWKKVLWRCFYLLWQGTQI